MEIRKILNKRPKKFWFKALFIAALIVTFVVLKIQAVRYETAVLDVGGERVVVEVADTPMKITKGLSGRAALATGAGMLFLFSEPTRPAFWMVGMRFPLDLIWLEGERIVDLSPRLPPTPVGALQGPLYYPRLPVTAVLEVNAGFIEETGLKIGDRVKQVR